MHVYKQVLSTMRLGESDRAIARHGLVSRTKAKQIREVAIQQGWLGESTPLPDEEELAAFFKKSALRKSTESFAQRYAEEITRWVEQGIQAT